MHMLMLILRDDGTIKDIQKDNTQPHLTLDYIMQQTAVIGDIHGCLDSLNALLDLVTPLVDTIIFLGDYVDRGPRSKEVVDRIVSLKKELPRVITLKGNHDFLFSRFMEKAESSLFLAVGGDRTLASYNISPEVDNPFEHIPASHVHFFHDLLLYYEDQHAIYVHAGLQPGVHLSLQRPEWCLWARENFLGRAAEFGKPVVFGHTVFPTPFVQDDKIGIDTGAVYGGELTALLLPEKRFISVPGEQNDPFPSP